jgi:hypothetical protein
MLVPVQVTMPRSSSPYTGSSRRGTHGHAHPTRRSDRHASGPRARGPGRCPYTEGHGEHYYRDSQVSL